MGWQDDEVISGGSNASTPAPGTAVARAAWESDEVIGGRGNSPPARRGEVEEIEESPSNKKEVSLPARVGVGANKAISSMIGAPVDAATWLVNNSPGTLLVNKGAQLLGYDPPIPEIKNPIGGSGTVKQVMGLIGANPDDVRPAATMAEKVLEETGSGIASAVLPGMTAEAMLLRSTRGANDFLRMTGEMIKGTGVVSNAVIGGASGAGAEIAAEVAPPEYEPVARLVGGVVGGGVAAVGTTALESGVRTAGRAARTALESPEVAAARRLKAAADDPTTIPYRVSDAADAPPLVDGSRPTTFQATGDLGIGALERDVASSPAGLARFAERRIDQNAARTRVLEGLADDSVSPDAVSVYVKARLQGLSDEVAAGVASARQGLDDTLTRAGGQTFDNEADFGSALRAVPAARRDQLKTDARSLWQAFEEVRDVPVDPISLRQRVREIEASIPRMAEKPEGRELDIINLVRGLDETTNVGDVAAIRSRILKASREARSTQDDVVLRRLNMVLDEVDNTLADTAGRVAADPSRRAPLLANIEADAGAWRTDGVEQGATRAVAGGSDQGLAAPGAGGVPSARGAEGAGGGRPGVPPGDQGVPGDGADFAQRYDAARTATREIKDTFGRGATGRILAPGDQYGSFKMTASNVAKNVFDRPEDLKNYLKAAGDNPAGRAMLGDYAAFSLRKAAVKDGVLSPQRYDQWVQDHAYVLREFPDLQAKFADVRTAQTALDEAVRTQKESLAAFQTASIRRLVNDADPVQVAGTALAKPEEFGALVNLAKDDKQALAGLKRATMDWILGKAQSTAEAGASGVPQLNAATLQKVYLQNRKGLSLLFDDQEMKTLGAITADLQRANRSIAALRIPGGSNTRQDTASSAGSFLQKAWREYGGKAIGTTGGASLGPVGSAAGFIAGAAFDAVQTARMSSIDNAVIEMMLDPKVAAAWMARIPSETPAAANAFARRLRALSFNQVMQAIEDEATDDAAPSLK